MTGTGPNKWYTTQLAIVRCLKRDFVRFKRVRKHGNSYSLSDIKRFSTSPLTARVAWLGTSDTKDAVGRTIDGVPFAIHIIARDRPRKDAYTEVMRWAEQVAEWVKTVDLGLTYIKSVVYTGTTNMHSTSLDRHGVSIAQVKFTVRFALDGANSAPNIEGTVKSIDLLRRSEDTTIPGSVEFRRKLTVYHTAKAVITTSSGLSAWGRVGMDGKAITHTFTLPFDSALTTPPVKGHIVRRGTDLYDIESVENKDEADEAWILRCSYRGRENAKSVV